MISNLDKELTDALQCQLLFLDQDTDGVAHEALGDLEHVSGHRGRQQDHLTESTENHDINIELPRLSRSKESLPEVNIPVSCKTKTKVLYSHAKVRVYLSRLIAFPHTK